MVSNNEIKVDSYSQESLDTALVSAFEMFSNKVDSFRPMHLFTRRMASVASIIFLFGLLNILGKISFIEANKIESLGLSPVITFINQAYASNYIIIGHLVVLITGDPHEHR